MVKTGGRQCDAEPSRGGPRGVVGMVKGEALVSLAQPSPQGQARKEVGSGGATPSIPHGAVPSRACAKQSCRKREREAKNERRDV
jgi:hypothetical protein